MQVCIEMLLGCFRIPTIALFGLILSTSIAVGQTISTDVSQSAAASRRVITLLEEDIVALESEIATLSAQRASAVSEIE